MLRGMYDWTLRLASTPHAVWALAAVAFVESSVFPIPPDVLLAPMVLAVRQRAWLLAAICTIASVLGGYLGYAIGALLFDVVGQPIFDRYSLNEAYELFKAQYNDKGIWIVATFGITVLPYKLVTIASGAVDMNPVLFGLASVTSRGLRFFIVAALLWYFGEPVRRFIEANLPLLTLAFCVLLVGGFVVIRYLV